MAALKVEEWDRMIDVNIKGLLYRAGRGAADHAEAKAGSHHQHRFCRGLQSLRGGRHGLQRDEIRRAGGD
jgi:hypothetical protein